MRTISLQGRAWRPWLGQVPLAGQRRSRSRMGDAVELTDSTFSQALKAPAAVVDFWSPTCLPCMKFKPVFEDVAVQMGTSTILMATVNADNATATLAQYAIDSLPTQLYLLKGQEVHRTEGNISRDQLVDEIARAFPDQVAQAFPMPADQTAQAQPAPPPTPPDQVMPAPALTPPDQVMPGPAPTPPAPPTPPEVKLPAPTPKPATTAPTPQKQAPMTTPPSQAPAATPAAGGGFLTTPVIVGGIAGIAVIVGIVIASSGK